jgi:hypothetical protein
LAALQTESTGFSYFIHVCYFLARQFHTAIVENNKETHPNSHLAFSVVPTTFQPFVFPMQGNISFEGKDHNADTY